MQNIKELSNALQKLETLSNKILKKSLPIMKDINGNDSEIVNDLLIEIPEMDERTAKKILVEIITNHISDAESVQTEIEKFSEIVVLGEDEILDKGENFPFLLEVWQGDAYGKVGVEALIELIKELECQILSTKNKDIVEAAMSKVNIL